MYWTRTWCAGGKMRLLITLAIFGLTAFACRIFSGSSHKARVEHTQRILDELFSIYLNGEVSAARESQIEALDYINGGDFSSEDRKCLAFHLTYLRLSLLEKQEGNDLLHEAYMLKARYWHLLTLEKGGKETSDAILIVKDKSDVDYLDIIRNWDERANNLDSLINAEGRVNLEDLRQLLRRAAPSE